MLDSISRTGTTGGVRNRTNDGYTVRHGDTLSGIAAKNGISLAALRAANPQIRNPNLIFPGQTIALPQSGAASYTVQAGDTLSGIAARFELDWHDLALDNGLANPGMILPGQTLRLNGGGKIGRAHV